MKYCGEYEGKPITFEDKLRIDLANARAMYEKEVDRYNAVCRERDELKSELGQLKVDAAHTAKLKQHAREFSLLFFSQIISYGLVTYGFLKLSERNMPATLLADALNATFAFFVIRRIARSEDSLPGWVGYVLGSLVGTALGMSL